MTWLYNLYFGIGISKRLWKRVNKLRRSGSILIGSQGGKR